MIRIPEPVEVMDIPERAQAYADADFTEVNQSYVDRVLELFQTGEPIRVLDVGTGPGEIPRLISKARSSWEIVGVDASAPMLNLALSNTSVSQLERVRWVLADSKKLPFPDGSFDLILSNSILHHIIDPHSFWCESIRLMRPGGGMFHRDLTRPDSEEIAQDIVEMYSGDEHPLLKEDFYNSLLAAYHPDEVKSQFNSAGITQMHVDIASDRHMDMWCSTT